MEEYDQIKLCDEYDKELINRKQDSKDLKSGKNQENNKQLVKAHKESNMKKKNEAHNVNKGGKISETEDYIEREKKG